MRPPREAGIRMTFWPSGRLPQWSAWRANDVHRAIGEVRAASYRERDQTGEPFDDDAWVLAFGGDHTGLELLMSASAAGSYAAHRAAAFAKALRGQHMRALEELAVGWDAHWPPPQLWAIDVATVHLLAGEAAHAVQALDVGLRGTRQLPDRASMLLERC